MMFARSVAEAHLFMDLRGAEPGPRNHALIARGDDLVATYRPKIDGVEHRFEFDIPEPMPKGGMFGGPEPSKIIGPAEFLAHADAVASTVPGSADRLSPAQRNEASRRLGVALACLDEVMKFIPPGQDAVPESAFVSDRDRELRAKEPGRYSRVRLLAVAGAYRNLVQQFNAS
jgi:hypothetical protein